MVIVGGGRTRDGGEHDDGEEEHGHEGEEAEGITEGVMVDYGGIVSFGGAQGGRGVRELGGGAQAEVGGRTRLRMVEDALVKVMEGVRRVISVGRRWMRRHTEVGGCPGWCGPMVRPGGRCWKEEGEDGNREKVAAVDWEEKKKDLD